MEEEIICLLIDIKKLATFWLEVLGPVLSFLL